MNKFVTIQTTQDDIDAWLMVEGGAQYCPIFRALYRAGVGVTAVGPGFTFVGRKPFRNSRRMHRWIDRLDAHKPVAPARFRVQVEGAFVRGGVG